MTTHSELQQQARDYLAKAFTGLPGMAPPSHIVQAAVAIIQTPASWAAPATEMTGVRGRMALPSGVRG